MQLVIAAITTDPWSSSALGGHASACRACVFTPFFRSGNAARRRSWRGERHAILRPAWTGKARNNRREIERDRFAVDRIRCTVDAEQALRLGVILHQPDVRGVAAREPQVLERHAVDREDRYRRAVLRAHIAERRAIGNGQMRQSLSVELDELSDHTVFPQQFGDREHQIGGRDAFGQPPPTT